VSTDALSPADVSLLRREEALGEPFLVEVLRSLVRSKSINPGIARSEITGVFEGEMAERVIEWLRPTGAECTVVEFEPGRPSVGAVIRGAAEGPRLVLNGHMDTVPIDDESLWSVEPFSGEIRDGYMYGRGACDMKAGLTVQIAVAHYLSKHVRRMSGSLVLHFAAGEECGEPGTLSLLEAGFRGDVGITTEPTELQVATAERGIGYYTIRIKGRSIHASKAHLGLNPNRFLPPVLQTIEAYERDIQARTHPLLPSASCTPTVIRAGVKENAVPDACEVTVDRRLLPGETADGELEALRTRLDRIRDEDERFEFEISQLRYAFEPAEIDPESGFAKQVQRAVEEVTGDTHPITGTPYGSDVRNLVNDGGIEAVTFGPGNVAECHCADERVSIPQVRDAALVTAKVAADLLLA
jgi:succinyl-diaminopimelate desuccinylase